MSIKTAPYGRGSVSILYKIQTEPRPQGAVHSRGSALLAVLWLTAALSAIAFTVANTVRAETDRTSTEIDSVRADFLASAAIERALLYIEWGPMFRNEDGTTKYFQNPMPLMHFDFPSGAADVQLIPDSAKLSLNTSPREELSKLMAALSIPQDRAEQIVEGIVDWRSPSPGESFTRFDQHYLALNPSFRARHASFQEIEELLLIQGVTPDLFYGSYTRVENRLVPRPGLRDCLSVFGSNGPVDINTAHPSVLAALGIGPDVITEIVTKRKSVPFRKPEELGPYQAGAPGARRLAIAPSSIATLISTARLNTGSGQFTDLKHSISAVVKFLGPEWDPPYHIMRWYDNAATVQ
jgi:general secretion pathway protein K